MNDQFRPEEEARLARDIDKALRPLDEEPSQRISPDSIVSRIREEPMCRPLPFYRQKRWIAVLSTMAACMVVVIAAAASGLLLPHRKGIPSAAVSTASYQSAPDMNATETADLSGGSIDSNNSTEVMDGANATAAFTGGTRATGKTDLTTQKGTAAKSTAASKKGSSTMNGGDGGKEPPGAAQIALLSDAQAAAYVQNGALLVDVRSAEAYGAGHRDGAIHQPLDAIRQENYGSLPKATPLIVYGTDTKDGADAASRLLAAGYQVKGYLNGYAG